MSVVPLCWVLSDVFLMLELGTGPPEEPWDHHPAHPHAPGHLLPHLANSHITR